MPKEPTHDPIKQALDAFRDQVDVATQVKLNEARHTALAQADRTPRRRWLLPAAGVATMAAVTFTWALLKHSPSEWPEQDPSIFADLELLAEEADTDFYQDLEFLTWLDDNDLMESDI
ncbi:hypothetical protein [Marinicella meishanensis]|uniref:hypothetical protein n=1 Tax=Marinicella meishanensis TaxID=2873263 RepID=UPI001CBDAF69|nr:hypothetical protein [Marinicella sp. NBU2979]